MIDKPQDNDRNKDNDITTIIFQTFKKAEPIIILASVSLAVGALVASRGKYQTIFNHSIISSFMFIFSFGFYVFYELCKKYYYPTKELKPDEYSNHVFNYNMVRFAPIYFVAMGIMFLIIIAYDFGIGDNLPQPNLPQSSKNPFPIFLWASLFFVSYFLFYVIYTIIKSLIISKKTPDIPRKTIVSYFLTKLFLFLLFLLLELYIFMELIGLPQFNNNQAMVMYSFYILVGFGIVGIIERFFSLFKKRKTTKIIIALIISGFFLLSIPLAIMFILQGVGVLDKNFDPIEYAINASKNILPYDNQTNRTLSIP
jgi:hypothetical protein